MKPEVQGVTTVGYFCVLLAVIAGVLLSWRWSANSMWLTVLSVFAITTIALRPPRATAGTGLVLVVVAGLLRLDLPALGATGQWFGLLAVAACLLPFVIRPLPRLSGFPFLHVFCLLQGIYLAVGFLLGTPGEEVSSVIYTPARRVAGLGHYAVFMALVSISGVAVSLVGGRGNRRSQLLEKPTHAPDAGRTFYRAAAVFTPGFAMHLLLISGGRIDALGTLPDFLSLLRVLGFAAMVWLWLTGRLAVWQKVLVVAIGGFDVFLGLGTGSIYQSAALALSTLILILVRRRTIPWIVLLVGVSLAVVLNAAKVEFREGLQRPVGPTPAVVPEAVRFADITAGLGSSTTVADIEQSAWRFAFSDLLGYTMDVVPSRYDYWDKRSYIYLPYVVVPRVIAPWKPKYDNANEFGRRFGLLSSDDYVTSANTPIAVEAYVNLGYSGFVGVGIMTGLFLGWAEKRVRALQPGHVLIGTVVSLQLAGGIESGITSWALALPTALTFAPLSRWLFGGKPPAQNRQGKSVSAVTPAS